MSSERIDENYEKLFSFYAKKFPDDPNDVVKELMEIDIRKLMESGKSRDKAILEILEQFETFAQQIKDYEEAIKKLTILFAKGEISEETYKTSVKDIEKKLSDLKQTEKEPEISEEGKVHEEMAEKPFEPAIPKVTATQVIVGVIVFLLIIGAIVGAIFYFSIPKERTVTFRIVVESNTSWSGAFGTLEEGQTTIEGSGGRTIYFKGTICSAVVQKQTDYGYLRVSIYVGNTLKATQETTAAYGVVSVSASA